MRVGLSNEPWLEPFLEGVRGLVFFDVGANVGDFSEWASRRFDIVYAFEPDPRAFERLEERARCNVRAFPVAVAAESGKGILGVNTNSPQSMLMEDDRSCHPFGHGAFERSVEVDVIAIKDVSIAADWIKIDVEGGEPEVIRGLPDNFSNLIIECHRNLDEVLAELRAKGYLGDRPGIVIDHPLGISDHKWVIAKGSVEDRQDD